VADYHLSKGDIKLAVAINPVNWKYRFYYANKLRNVQKFRMALEMAKTTIVLNPYHINSWNNLAVNYVALKEHKKAVNIWKNALKISPKNRIMIKNLEAMSNVKP